MQERRTTVRKTLYTRTQYCPSEDLELRDGRIADVSERGAGVLMRERHRGGELVTVGFSLPGEEDTLTATGVVRWSGPESPTGQWHRIGLEWLPLEEGTRNRLHRYLETAKPIPDKARRLPAVPSVVRIGIAAGFAAVALSAWMLFRWGSDLQEENFALESTVQQRDAIIGNLGQEGRRLKIELGEARKNLAATAGEVARLDLQAQTFGKEVDRLSQDVQKFQSAYLQAHEERGELMQKVLLLEQEKANLAKRLNSVDDLKLAIRDAIESRKQSQQAQRLRMLKAQRESQERWLSQGNRGFLIRDGRPTVNKGTVWIRVHEPETRMAAPIENGQPVSAP
jgi:archaellum component FlaC